MECHRCHSAVSDEAVYCPACGAAQPGVDECTDYRYTAFISYRHVSRDQEVACDVQRVLETYRPPKSIATVNPISNRSLGKCFRDEDELSAAPSLPDRICEALKQSYALVVVCSPDTHQSEWVQREVETFIEYHGRDRVFAVLADGSSQEGIPSLLKTRLTVGSNGAVKPTRAEPLAADFRPEAHSRRTIEQLRLIAAVAGCNYDDLAQRAQTRRRKRISIGIAASLVTIALVIGGVGFAYSKHQNALVAESQKLAVESRQLLEKGDRYGAIETALAALPASSSDTSRPLVPEAQQALERALEFEPSDSSSWFASYRITTENTVSMIGDTSIINKVDELPNGASALTVSDAGGFFAISDDAGIVTTYDTKTGRRLATCPMPDAATPLDNGFYKRALIATADQLVVSNVHGNGVIACFDAFSGELQWSRELSAPAMALSDDTETIGVISLSIGGELTAIQIDASSGNTIAAASFGHPVLPDLSHGAWCAMGGGSTMYAAIGDAILSLDFATGNLTAAELSHPEAVSLGFRNGIAIATCIDGYDGEHLELAYSIEAFDQQLHKIWERDGSTVSEMDRGNYITLVNGWPTIRGFTEDGTDAVAITAGRRALALSLTSGAALLDQEFSSIALDASPWRVNDERDWLFVVCADGSVTACISNDPGNTNGDAFRMSFGDRIRWGAFCLSNDSYTSLALISDSNNTVAAYRTPLHDEKSENSSHSLDESIAYAHALIDSVAQ